MAKTIFYPADERGYAHHGWLEARHSFSFAGYYDPKKMHFGALRVLNDDLVAGGGGFDTHPHDNMEIITIMLSGILEHKDSMGHTQTLAPNEVQVMSAGTGLTHSEYNHLKDQRANILQSWIFPKVRNVAPRYDQTTFDEQESINRLQPLVSPMDTQDPGLKINQDAWIYRSRLGASYELDHTLHYAHNGVYILLISGSITVGTHTLNTKDALGISETDAIHIVANADSDFLLYEVPMH